MNLVESSLHVLGRKLGSSWGWVSLSSVPLWPLTNTLDCLPPCKVFSMDRPPKTELKYEIWRVKAERLMIFPALEDWCSCGYRRCCGFCGGYGETNGKPVYFAPVLSTSAAMSSLYCPAGWVARTSRSASGETQLARQPQGAAGGLGDGGWVPAW